MVLKFLLSCLLGITIYFMFYTVNNIELVVSLVIPTIIFSLSCKLEEIQTSSHTRDAKILALIHRGTNEPK